MGKTESFTIRVSTADSGMRLDALISVYNKNSRTFLAKIVRNGHILVDGAVKKPCYKVAAGDVISGAIPPPVRLVFDPEPIPIDSLYEDNEVLVLNKPAGLVVHPAPGNYSGTLVNGLLYYYPEMACTRENIRPGIVHRLDKNTSGVLVVAKNSTSHTNLASQFKDRKVKKIYLALVYGNLKSSKGVIELPLGRHPVDRKKMSVKSRNGRYAKTFWRVLKQYQGAALIEVILDTGRTHQIRVHCAAIGHPVIGDPVYCSAKAYKNFIHDKNIAANIISVKRQMLHAWKLSFIHPVSNKLSFFKAPLPGDMKGIIKLLGGKYE